MIWSQAGDHVEVVLDDDESAAAGDEGLENGKQAGDVVAVQADGGLVEEIEGFSLGALGEFAREADPLLLAAREGGDLLVEPEVIKADGNESVEDLGGFRDGIEELFRFKDSEAEDFSEIFSFISDREA